MFIQLTTQWDGLDYTIFYDNNLNLPILLERHENILWSFRFLCTKTYFICECANVEGKCVCKEEIDDVGMKILIELKVLNYAYEAENENVLQLWRKHGHTLFTKL